MTFLLVRIWGTGEEDHNHEPLKCGSSRGSPHPLRYI